MWSLSQLQSASYSDNALSNKHCRFTCCFGSDDPPYSAETVLVGVEVSEKSRDIIILPGELT